MCPATWMGSSTTRSKTMTNRPFGIEAYERKTQAHVWVMAVIGVVGFVIVLLT